MKNAPDLNEITDKVRLIIEESVDKPTPLPVDKPLIAELGLDSLDMIESSFAIQECFEFELSDRDAMDVLDEALGKGVIIQEGKLTPLGRDMALKRMPELRAIDMPEQLSTLDLQRYLTIESFGRLVHQFYTASPDVDPESGENLVVRNFIIETEESKTPFPPPKGEALLDAWVAETAAGLRAEGHGN